MQQKIIVGAVLSIFAAVALAGPNCGHYSPKERLSWEKAQTLAEQQGITVRDIEYDDGCYEVKGQDKNGKRTKLYMDGKTGKVLPRADKDDRDDRRKMPPPPPPEHMHQHGAAPAQAPAQNSPAAASGAENLWQ